MSTHADDNDLVYMSISFVSVKVSHAEDIVRAALEAAGPVSVSVFYDEPKTEESDEPQPADNGVVVASSTDKGGYLPPGVTAAPRRN